MMEEAALTSSRVESVAATAPAEKAVPLPLGHGSLREEKMRRGEYRNFTFRLPAHVPEIQLSVAAECGSICLYASNCSERPTPRLCQWTLLVDAEKQKMGSLKVKTSEHHFVTGLYHVGLYCVSDSSFSLGCFTTTPSPSDVLHAAQKRRSQQLAECPRRQGQPPPRATHKRPFVDEGVLEGMLSNRAQQLSARAAAAPCYSSSASSAPMAQPASAHQTPGAMHYDYLLGDWHRSLRERQNGDASPRRVGLGHRPAMVQASNGLLPPMQRETIAPTASFMPAPKWLGGLWV